MSEFTHFEGLSAKIPIKGPLIGLGGLLMIPILVSVLNALAPTEQQKGAKAAKAAAEQPAATQTNQADDGDEL